MHFADAGLLPRVSQVDKIEHLHAAMYIPIAITTVGGCKSPINYYYECVVQGSWDGSYDDDDDNGAEGPAAKALRSLEQQVVLQSAATIKSMPTICSSYAVAFFNE